MIRLTVLRLTFVAGFALLGAAWTVEAAAPSAEVSPSADALQQETNQAPARLRARQGRTADAWRPETDRPQRRMRNDQAAPRSEMKNKRNAGNRMQRGGPEREAMRERFRSFAKQNPEAIERFRAFRAEHPRAARRMLMRAMMRQHRMQMNSEMNQPRSRADRREAIRSRQDDRPFASPRADMYEGNRRMQLVPRGRGMERGPRADGPRLNRDRMRPMGDAATPPPSPSDQPQ